MRLEPYTGEDFWLTEALETDAEVMRELGGPIGADVLPDIHRRRVGDPWWLKIIDGGTAVGTIGVWETRHGGHTVHETGWMVLPAHQGRGVASAALRLLIARIRAEPGIPEIHAFPPVTNAPSNGLCRRAAFTLLGQVGFVYAGRNLHCNHWKLDTPRRE